jgi:hypothetical protein
LERYPLPVIIRAIMVLSALSPLAFAILPLVVEAQGLEQRYSIISSEPSVPETGWPEGRLVHCTCYSRDDLIAVFRVDGEKPISEQLDQDSDFDGTFWLIDVGARGYYQVAVRFYRDQDNLTADFWQDQDGDGKIAATPRDGTLQLTEAGFPSLRAVALDGYWQRDGRLAPNLDLLVDDIANAAFGSGPYLERMSNDGHTDAVIRVRGPSGSDPRAYDWRNIYTPISESSAILRTTLMVRESGTEPAFAPVFPWYLLGAWYGTAADPQYRGLSKIPLVEGSIPPYDIVKPYGESFAPIQVDWSVGKINTIGEFVASRGSEDNWFIYSTNRIEPDQISNPDFEDPFMFYDLAQDDDGMPELQVRNQSINEDDPLADEAMLWRGRPYQQIRYSWDQDNTGNWSYKVGVMGQHFLDRIIHLTGLSFYGISYAEFPQWVVKNKWDIATFVAAERRYWTSEGIYEGDFSRQMRDQYYSGANPVPGDLEDGIDVGLRLDYNLHLGNQPWLTFNSIDRQLHLRNATNGIWKIDDRRQLRYLNLAGGNSFDGWQLWEDARLISQLYRIPGGVLYSDDTVTLARKIDVPVEIFRTLPPTTTGEWKTLGERLAASRRAFAPGDLRAMFEQFGGKATRVAAGPLRDFRDTPTGVRFAVDASTRRDLRSIAKLIGARSEPGLQVLSLGPDGWSVERGTIALPVPVIGVTAARALAGTVARVTVENPGTMDLTDAVMDVEATSPEGDVALIAVDEPIAADGGSHVILDVPWTPTGPGSWTIEARIYRDVINEWSGERPLLVTSSAKIDVAGVPTVGMIDADRMGWNGAAPTWPLVPLGCAVLVAAVAGTVLRFSRPTG